MNMVSERLYPGMQTDARTYVRTYARTVRRTTEKHSASGWMHKINAVGIDCSLESALLCGHAELVVAPPFLSLFVDVGLHLRERVTADGHGRAEDVSQVSLVGAVSTLLPLARRI